MADKLPGLGGAPLGADPGPIQEDLRALMNAVAQGLDDVFNGPDCKPDDKRVWFFLAAGEFGHKHEPVTNRFNYISNADKLDVRATLHDVLARLEARMFEGGRA